MATFTITGTVNADTLTSKAGGDTYNINGGTLTFDQDSRYGVEQNTSATLGNITVSTTLGGNITFNAALVRLIPYNLGAGTVPAAGTTISQGSASGVLLGVYDSLTVAPTTAGSAMPVDGFIKIRQWNSVAYSAGLLTGITATATGADVVGWIEISGDESATFIVSRLGNTSTKIGQGAWYEIGTTDGNRATTYQIPSNGTLQYHGGVYVETGTGTGVYDFYPVSSETATIAKLDTDVYRGRFCWISTAGVLTFGNDGTNSTGGYIPPSGRKIVIGNVFFSCNTTAARTVNAQPNATLGTRMEFLTTGGGNIDFDKVSMTWYANFTNAFSVTLTNCGFLTQLRPQKVPTVTLTRVGVGQHVAATVASLDSTGCTSLTATYCRFGKSPYGSNGYPLSSSNIESHAFTSCDFITPGPRTNTTSGPISLGRANNTSFTSCVLGGGQVNLGVCDNVDFTNCLHYDATAGITTATTHHWFALTGPSNVTIDGSALTQVGVAPGAAVVRLAQSGASNILVRNCGTAASPVNLGTVAVEDVSWSRSGTTVTVTSTAHGLVTGATIAVYISSQPTPVIVAQRAITVVDANTFTFTGVNSGATSGTLSYEGAISSAVLSVQNDVYASTVKFQRCHFTNIKTGPNITAADNTNVNIYYENCTIQGYSTNNSVLSANRTTMRSTLINLARTVQTSVYGTIWNDTYTQSSPTTLTALTWARSTTTATVTHTGHGMITGNTILVTASSDTAAIVLGQKTITAVDSNTYTFTCLNAGGASGTIDIKPINGTLAIHMNEADSETTAQITVDAGTPKFTSLGTLVMPTVNDQVTWETPVYIKGHLNYPWQEATFGGMTVANYRVTYALNTGSGYGSFHNLQAYSATSAGTSATTTLTVADTTIVEVGDYVFGTNVAPFAKVASITDATTLELDIAHTGTVSGTIRFNHLIGESNNTSTGTKIKVRVKTLTANTDALSYILIPTYWNSTTRDYLYNLDPLPYQSVTVSGATAGSRIQLYDLTAAEELYNGTPTFPYTWTDTEEYAADREIRLRVSYVSGVTAKEYISTTIGTSTEAEPDLAYLVTQTDDTVYNTNAVNGSTTTGITISATRYSLTVSRTMAQVYAFGMYTAFTETGIRDYGLAISAVDTANYFLDEVLLKNTSSGPAIPISVTGGWVRDFDTGVALDLVDTTGGTLFLAPDHVVAYASASDYDLIADAVLDAAQSDHTTAGTIGKSIKDASKAKLLL